MLGRLVAICAVISLVIASIAFFLVGTIISDLKTIGLISAEIFAGVFTVCFLIIRPTNV